MIHIRPEKPSDYSTIADIHIRAFGNRSDEANIVTLLRQRQAYDVELSLVALNNNRLIGHALFMPYHVRFMQTFVQGVCLAPLSIHPDYQKQGVGGALMDAGHKTAIEKGYDVAFLLGHPDYYPKFGYQKNVYGHSTVTATREHIIINTPQLQTRQPEPDDIETFYDLWLYEEQNVDFTILPERNLSAWLSPNPNFEEKVYLLNDKIIGYTRGAPASPRIFLSSSPDNTRAIVSHMLRFAESVTLPLHPLSQSMQALPLEPPKITGWDAAMMKVLKENPAVTDYLNAIKNGSRPVGRPIWPIAFELS